MARGNVTVTQHIERAKAQLEQAMVKLLREGKMEQVTALMAASKNIDEYNADHDGNVKLD